ncbi:MAG: hypothetical protein PHQ46_11370 [Negativicutes bacterium]|nr:hypothetical protein [Negativicutes bacterium]
MADCTKGKAGICLHSKGKVCHRACGGANHGKQPGLFREIEKPQLENGYWIDAENIKKIPAMIHVHDRKCPKCGFPETVYIRNAKTGDILVEYCSSKKCDWKKIFLKN